MPLYPNARRALGILLLAPFVPLAAQGVYGVIAEQSRTAFTIQGAGARAAGTGGAFIAVADDGTAVSFNPAGLAQLLRPEVSFTAQSYNRNERLTGFATSDARIPTTQEDSAAGDHRTRPSFISMAVPWSRDGRNAAFQISYQRILDFDFASDRAYTATPTGGGAPRNITQNVLQDGGIDLYSAALAMELSPRILAGLSVNSWQGRWGFDSVSNRSVQGADVFDSTLTQENQFRGLNANLGLIWRSDFLNFGAVYRTPFTATYTFENYLVQPDPATGLIVTTHGARRSYDVKWPETFGWGLGLHPLSTLLLTADWSYTPWSKADFVDQGTAYDGRNWFDLAVASRTPNVRTFNTGAEWVAYVGDACVIPLRAGWFDEPQPIVDARTGTQRVLRGWTAGFGVKLRSFTVDVAYRDARNSRYVSRLNADAPLGGVSSYAYGTETFEEKRVFVSLIYQMDAEKMHRALGWLFKGE